MLPDSQKENPYNKATVWEGWYRGAMEYYDTDSERLAALTTILDMCFLGKNYVPIEKPTDREPTRIEKVVRKTYHDFYGGIMRSLEKNSATAKAKRIADGSFYGKMGGRGHKKGSGESSAVSDAEQTPSKPSQTNENGSSGSLGASVSQTPYDPAEADKWRLVVSKYAESIKSPEDLGKWILHNYIGPSPMEMRKADFLQFAYDRLTASGWRKADTNLPIKNLGLLLPQLLSGFKRFLKKKAEEEDAEKKREAEKKAKEEPEQTQQDIDDFRQRMCETEFD